MYIIPRRGVAVVNIAQIILNILQYCRGRILVCFLFFFCFSSFHPLLSSFFFNMDFREEIRPGSRGGRDHFNWNTVCGLLVFPPSAILLYAFHQRVGQRDEESQ